MARILITGFFQVPASSRSGIQLLHVMEALSREHHVEVFCLRSSRQSHNERFGRCRLLRVAPPQGSHKEQVEVFQRALRRQLEGGDYDVVHFFDIESGRTVLGMQATFGYATVFDLARSSSSEKHYQRPEWQAFLKSSIEQTHLVLVPSEKLRKNIVSKRGNDKVHVVAAGVNIDRFDWLDMPKGDERVILFVGQIEPGRGLLCLLDAFGALLLKKIGDGLKLVLAGPGHGPFVATMRTLLIERGLEQNVKIIGEVLHRDMPALLAKASLCVVPYAEKESILFPIRLLEYMACRKAVVAPDTPAIRKLLEGTGHKSGLLFEPESSVDLAETMAGLLADNSLRSAIAEAGYRQVRSAYSAGASRRALCRAYTWLGERVSFKERFEREHEVEGITGSFAGEEGSVTDIPNVRQVKVRQERPVDFHEDFTQVELFPMPTEMTNENTSYLDLDSEISVVSDINTNELDIALSLLGNNEHKGDWGEEEPTGVALEHSIAEVVQEDFEVSSSPTLISSMGMSSEEMATEVDEGEELGNQAVGLVNTENKPLIPRPPKVPGVHRKNLKEKNR